VRGSQRKGYKYPIAIDAEKGGLKNLGGDIFNIARLFMHFQISHEV
jgi:hypothetical protein